MTSFTTREYFRCCGYSFDHAQLKYVSRHQRLQSGPSHTMLAAAIGSSKCAGTGVWHVRTGAWGRPPVKTVAVAPSISDMPGCGAQVRQSPATGQAVVAPASQDIMPMDDGGDHLDFDASGVDRDIAELEADRLTILLTNTSEADGRGAGGVASHEHRDSSVGLHDVFNQCASTAKKDNRMPGAERAGCRTLSHSTEPPGEARDANPTPHTLSATEMALFSFIQKHNLTHAQADDLLKLVRSPEFEPLTVRYKTLKTFHEKAYVLQALQIHMANLHDTDIDGVNDGVLWYRDAVDIVIQMLEDPSLAPHIIWGCVPEYDAETGDRVYTSFANARWMEAAYAEFAHDPEVCIVSVVMASDGTSIKKRMGAHPFYISISNITAAFRRSLKAWKLAAFKPDMKRDRMKRGADGILPSKFVHARRCRQVRSPPNTHTLHA